MAAVEAVDEAEVALLRVALQRHGRIEVENARFLRADHGALIERRQPAVGEVVHSEHGQPSRIGEGDVGGQVAVFRAKAVGEPAPKGGASRENGAVVKGVDGLAVVVHPGVHRADHRDLVGDAGHVRHQFAEVHPALAVLGEFPGRAHHLAARAGGVVELQLPGELLAVEAR